MIFKAQSSVFNRGKQYARPRFEFSESGLASRLDSVLLQPLANVLPATEISEAHLSTSLSLEN